MIDKDCIIRLDQTIVVKCKAHNCVNIIQDMENNYSHCNLKNIELDYDCDVSGFCVCTNYKDRRNK